MRRSVRDFLMSRSALRSSRQQLLTAFRPTQLGLCYRIRDGTQTQRGASAATRGRGTRRRPCLPDSRVLDGREFVE